jgi:hypothetical protein
MSQYASKDDMIADLQRDLAAVTKDRDELNRVAKQRLAAIKVGIKRNGELREALRTAKRELLDENSNRGTREEVIEHVDTCALRNLHLIHDLAALREENDELRELADHTKAVIDERDELKRIEGIHLDQMRDMAVNAMRREEELDELREELADLQMQLDASCNAEELRQVREERDELRQDKKRLRKMVCAHLPPHAMKYAKEHRLPDGFLYYTHFDDMKEAGCRMDDFGRFHPCDEVDAAMSEVRPRRRQPIPAVRTATPKRDPSPQERERPTQGRDSPVPVRKRRPK